MMSEIWQFGALILAGIAAAVAWFFIIYKPRHTVEGEGEPADPLESTPEDEEKS